MIYFLQRANGDIKIGFTEHYYQRRSTLKSKYGHLELIGYLDGRRAEERALHIQFAEFNTGTDGKEWFYPRVELMEFIKTQTHNPTPEEVQVLNKAGSPKWINVEKSTHHRIREYAIGLDTKMGDAIHFMLCEAGLSVDGTPIDAYRLGESLADDFKAWKAKQQPT